MLLMERETIDAEELEALFEHPRPRPQLIGPSSYDRKAPVLTEQPEQQERPERREPEGTPRFRPQPASG
jgi:cell division protease FtsH